VPTLAEVAASHLDRRAIETLLGVSQTEANRVLKRAGAVALSGRLLIARSAFQAWLEEVLERQAVDREEKRVQRVAETVVAARLTHQNYYRPRVTREEAAVELVSTRFRQLPPGVELTPGRFSIEFLGAGDFLAKFGAMVFALQNDFEEISAFLEDHGGGDRAATLPKEHAAAEPVGPPNEPQTP
jgi:hypothetical protein